MTPAAATEGPLGTITIAHLLAEAWRDRRSGTLQVSRDKTERHIHVHKGSPVAVESKADDEGFALMLERKGLIVTADRRKIEEMARSRECPQANAVLALRLLDASELYKAIRTATGAQIGETFEWQSGVYRWTEPIDDAESKGKPHDILNLLQDQLPTRWGFDRLIQELMPDLEIYGDISPRDRRVASKLADKSDAARQAIRRLDGSKNLGQVLGETAGDPIAAATLWTLLHTGVLRVREKRAVDAAVSAEVEFEFELTGGAPQSAGAAPGVRSNAGKAGTQPKENANAEVLRLEIASLLKRLSDLNHYDALGLKEKATAGEIKRAYFKAAKKFHPDALARLGLNDERDNAARVFGRIAEAFETLADENKRAAYDAGGGDEPEIDTARLAQAETSFRKGEILLHMGNFQGALDYLDPAVALWPEEPAYQCALGWALYKQPTPDTARAQVHLEKAASQSTDDAVVLYRLGVVLRAVGDTKEANKLIDRARELEPSIDE
jgi:tetratricopeptide (TPR) repeat protein